MDEKTEIDKVRDGISHLMSIYGDNPEKLRQVLNQLTEEGTNRPLQEFILFIKHPTLYGRRVISAVYIILEMILAAVFFMLGAVKKATFCIYNQEGKKYMRNKVVNKPLEVLSCIGNIAKHKGDVAVHAHITLSDEDGRCYGGHLVRETTVFAGEVYLVELLEVDLEREYDPVTGLNLFL